MSGRSQHNYQWLFEHLAEALDRAENDAAYNQKYGFYAQQSVHYVQWPRRFLEELAVKYSQVTGLNMTAAQLRTKIANTRVKAFVAMAENTKAPWEPLMYKVNHYDAGRLLKHRPREVSADFFAPTVTQRKRTTPPRVYSNHPPLSGNQREISRRQPPRAAPATSAGSPHDQRPVSYGTVLNSADRIENAEVDLDSKLSALDKLSGASNVCTVHDSLINGELKMAFLLSQHLKLPAITRV